MFCVLVKYQDLNMLLVLIKMFRAWFLFLPVEEISTIFTTKDLLYEREQTESLVSKLVSRDFAVIDGHFNCSLTEIWAIHEGGTGSLQKQLLSTVCSGGNGEAPEIQLEGRESLDADDGDRKKLEEEEKGESLKLYSSR